MLEPQKKKKINFHLSYQTGSEDILKMYKYFPNLEFQQDGTIGCYVTKVLMDSGFIWSKVTKDGPARGKPSRFSSRTWRLESQNFQSEEALRISWRGEGFTLPKGYWCGPKPALVKKADLKKEKEIRVQPDDFRPSGFRITKDFLKKSQEQAQRIQDYKNSKIKGLRRLEDDSI